MRSSQRVLYLAACAVVIHVSVVKHAAAQYCEALLPNVCVTRTGVPYEASFSGPNNASRVVGVLPGPGDDKDIVVKDACGGGVLASSTRATGADFVFIDLQGTPAQNYGMDVTYGSPTTPFTATVHSPASEGQYYYSGVLGTSESDCIMKLIPLPVNAATYRFTLQGLTGTKVAVFHNPGSGRYLAERNAADFELAAGSSTTYSYSTATTIAIVVFIDSPVASTSFDLFVEPLNDCDTFCGGTADWPEDLLLTKTTPYWAVTGVVPTEGDDKDVAVFTACDGGGTSLAYSNGTNGTDFVVADFNYTPYGSYYPRVTYGSHTAPFSFGSYLQPGSALPHNTATGGTLQDCGFQIWDVYLEAGKQYMFSLALNGPQEAGMALFRNPSASAYWAGRSGAQWEQLGTGNHSYSAPAAGWYGLVVFKNWLVHDIPFTIRVSEPATAVENGTPPASLALDANHPNPFDRQTTISFDVPRGGTAVSVRVYDVTGALVRTLWDTTSPQGTHELVWDGTDNAGRRVSAGVYFCRMVSADFQAVRKMMLLR